MTDKLTDRLRGQYQVGLDGVYVTRSFADFIPPISLEAANRIESLESALKHLLSASTDYIEYEHDGDPDSEDARAMGEMELDELNRLGLISEFKTLLENDYV